MDVKFLAKKRFATCTSNFVIIVWQIGASRLPTVATRRAFRKEKAAGLVFNNKKLAAFTLSGTLLTLNPDTLSQVSSVKCCSDWIMAAAPLCDGAHIATVSVDQMLVFCEPPKSYTPKAHLFRNRAKGKDIWPMTVCVLESDSVMIGDSEGFVSEYLPNGRFVMQKRLHGQAITALLALGGNMVVTASDDSTVKIWQLPQESSTRVDDPAAWKQLRQFYSTSPVTSLCTVSKENLLFLVGNKLGQVHLLRMLP